MVVPLKLHINWLNYDDSSLHVYTTGSRGCLERVSIDERERRRIDPLNRKDRDALR